MIFSIDLWHKNWGFGFTIFLWERDVGELIKFDVSAQLKLFGRTWGGGEK